MTNVNWDLDDLLVQRIRNAAVREGKSEAAYASEMIERGIGRPRTQREAAERFLAGPLMNLTDENGRAPTRDQLYDD
jgi:hypothetical protein